MKLPIRNTLILVLVLIVFGLVYLSITHNGNNEAHETQKFAQNAWTQFKNAEPITFNPQNSFSIVGNNSNSKNILYLYFDFNCEKCLSQLEKIKKLSEIKKFSLNLVPYPLSKDCNPNVTTKGESYSCYFAQFLYCVESLKGSSVDAILKLHNLHQTNQKYDPISDIQSVGATMGLNAIDVKNCMHDPDWVKLKSKVADKNFKNYPVSLPQLIINNKIFHGTNSSTAVDYLFQHL